MKKLNRILSAAAACMSLTMFAGAFDETAFDDLISIDEYETAIQTEGKKYGMEFYFTEHDSNVKVKREHLNQALNDIRTYGETKETNTLSINKSDSVFNNISPYNMPVTKNVSKAFLIKNMYGRVNMRADANVTVNVQNGDVISVNSTDAYPNGSYSGFVDWNLKNITSQCNVPRKGWIRLTIYGTAQFEYTDPYTNYPTGYYSNEAISLDIECD